MNEHQPQLAHHFDSQEQQFQTAKLGMWIFLATEILMFGGLFCAYAVYRSNHPDIFLYAHHFLDQNLGALNTIILLTSSLTMAWSVRAAQLGRRGLLVIMLLLTLLGGFGFIAVKAVEYQDKWQYKWVGFHNMFYPGNESLREEYFKSHGYDAGHYEDGSDDTAEQQIAATEQADLPADTSSGPMAARTQQSPPSNGPDGLSDKYLHTDQTDRTPVPTNITYDELSENDRYRVHLFFQIYFLLTGLHGVHVLVGMVLIFYLLVRAMKGHFSPGYYTPVDLIGLYWHLVDMIWIFLFPLLYLIH